MVLTLLEVLGIIAVLLTVVTTLGAPACSFLPDSVPRQARWGLAPAVGLAIAICLLTSFNWWLPGTTVAIVALAPALAVAGVVLWRRRAHMWGRGAVRDAAAPMALALAVAVTFAAPLAYQHSLGPGGFQVWDGPNYASTQLALVHNAVTDHDFGPDWSLSVGNGEHFVNANALHQQIGFDSVAATVDGAVHLSPVHTQVPFMIGLVVIGALGSYAVFLAWLGRTWAALLAGMLYAGPVLLQLILDGSEGALAGIAHVLPMLGLGVLALRSGSGRAPAVLFALVAASAAAAYPVYFPALAAAAGAIWLVVLAVRVRRAPQPRRGVALSAVGGLALVAAGTALAAPFAFHRSLDYWKILIKGGGEVAGLPHFDLPLPVLPGYVLGTREFFYLPHVTDTDWKQWLLADVLPLAMLALVAFAVMRLRTLWPLALLGAVLLVESFVVAHSDCSYCVQRSLLPLGPLSGFALAAGTVAIAAQRFRFARVVATVLGLAVLALTWHTNWVLVRRGALGAYFMPKSVTSMLSQADQHPGPVLLEGFMASYDAPGEFPSALLAADGGGYRPGGPQLSVLRETDDFAGLAYLGAPGLSGPEFSPNYHTVITRLGAVRTARRTLRRDGGLALQERVQPFDVTAENGILLNRARNQDHRVFVIGPMSFVVTGPAGRQVALDVRLGDLRRNQLGKLPPGSAVRRVGDGLSVCVRITGQRARIRRIVVPAAEGLVVSVSPGWYANRLVAISGPTLQSMRVVGSCHVRRR